VKLRVIAVALLALLLTAAAPSAHGLECRVQQAPISAAELNAVDPVAPHYLGQPGTWYYEVSGGTPGGQYIGELNWAKDPSNNAHANVGALLDENGYDLIVLPRYWQPDGTLPGYFAFWDRFNPISGFVAEPGAFSIHLYPADRKQASGNTKCFGEVTE
jgi:hypothetical protein